MKIKVCGMKYSDNIKAIQNLKPDFMGFIFYSKSKRYLNNDITIEWQDLEKSINKVGVFVNSTINDIVGIVEKYQLEFAQLHGNESVNDVKKLSETDIKIIKAFQIHEDFNWDIVSEYTPYVTYFLFDTAAKCYGGSGKKFNWNLLNHYKEQTPFILSGGISINDLQKIKNLNIPKLYGIDINSKFETEPGIKDVQLVKKMINRVRNETIVSR